MNSGSTDGLLPPTPALPPSSIALHVGVHKTGTTALQAALADARPDLVRHGVLYPGKKAAHHGAALGLMERSWGWKDRGGEANSRAAFDKLARQAAASPGRVIISSEHFCEVDGERAAEAADALGRDRIEVIITLRNLGRLLPSSWQQYLKYGVAAPYETWLENTFAAESKRTVSPSFWRRNNHHVLAQRWADVVGADRVTVIVLEDVDRSAMFRTFAQLLDLPEEILTTRMDLTSNRSMTAAESERVPAPCARRCREEHRRAARARIRRGPASHPRLGVGRGSRARSRHGGRHPRIRGQGDRQPRCACRADVVATQAA